MNKNDNEAGAQAPATYKEEQASSEPISSVPGHQVGIHQTAYWRKQYRYRGTVTWARY